MGSIPGLTVQTNNVARPIRTRNAPAKAGCALRCTFPGIRASRQPQSSILTLATGTKTMMDHPIFRALDHIAIVVPDTEQALQIWRDRAGLRLLYSEVVNEGTVRLTHLDLGNTQLQLVEPLTPDHPLQAGLRLRGPGTAPPLFSSRRRPARVQRTSRTRPADGPGDPPGNPWQTCAVRRQIGYSRRSAGGDRTINRGACRSASPVRSIHQLILAIWTSSANCCPQVSG